jgi:Uma2 family endonuclease
MVGVAQHNSPRLSVALFRAFYATRPEDERWQLIDGAAMMMAPPTPAHQRIASNLERLLNDALERHAPQLAAYQRLGVDLTPTIEGYDPEPDVLVIDAEAGETTEQRYVDRFYLAAEIVSSSDRVWVERKREIYKLHESCQYVVSVQQDRMHVHIDRRTDGGWSEQTLTIPDAVVELTNFGLRCTVADLYRGTALRPRTAPRH